MQNMSGGINDNANHISEGKMDGVDNDDVDNDAISGAEQRW